MALWIRPALALGTLINLTYHLFFPQFAFAAQTQPVLDFTYDKELAVRYQAQQAKFEALTRVRQEVAAHYHIITAYSSTPRQTDNDPFTTASGTRVRDGIVAANALPFGTKIMIPDLFGQKVFTVQDRMAPKNAHKIDIWFPSTQQALQFGVRKARILVIPQSVVATLENPSL